SAIILVNQDLFRPGNQARRMSQRLLGTKQHKGNHKGNQDIKQLRDEESIERLPAVLIKQISETCFEPDAGESEREPEALQTFQAAFNFRIDFRWNEKREDQGGTYKAEHKLREAFPNDTQGRFGILPGSERIVGISPVNGDSKSCDTQQYVL